jgi:hypothetical protein
MLWQPQIRSGEIVQNRMVARPKIFDQDLTFLIANRTRVY